MKKILITGATSFLGSHLLKKLQGLKIDVLATSNHSDVTRKIIKMDLTNSIEVKNTIDTFKPYVVVHIGALVDLSRDFIVSKNCIDINTIGTMNLLESVKSYKPLFIYISSEEVYGDTPIPFNEDQLTSPPSPYAISKLSGENFSQWYGKEYSFSVVVLRLGTLYGPNQPKYKYFNTIIRNALKHEPIPCNSGEKKRDYLYIEDGVNLIVNVLNITSDQYSQLKNNNIINVTGGKSYSLLYVIETIKKLINSTSVVQIGVISDRITERNEWIADISKANKIFGWKPETNLEDGLKNTIDSISN